MPPFYRTDDERFNDETEEYLPLLTPPRIVSYPTNLSLAPSLSISCRFMDLVTLMQNLE